MCTERLLGRQPQHRRPQCSEHARHLRTLDRAGTGYS
jgi:hypothetical protein